MQQNRRPWMSRDSASSHSNWREGMRALADASLENWPQLLTIGLGILAYFTLLHR